MTSPFSDELISAYLDGELTAQEQARVEKQLSEDVELRKMCDDMRALRFTLQAMPTADPSEDLAERVLRQAERRMLLGDDQRAEDDSVGQPGSRPVRAAIQATDSRQWNWRYVAGFVATAAALLLVAGLLIDPSGLAPTAAEVATTEDGGAPETSEADEQTPKLGQLVDEGESEATDGIEETLMESQPEEDFEQVRLESSSRPPANRFSGMAPVAADGASRAGSKIDLPKSPQRNEAAESKGMAEGQGGYGARSPRDAPQPESERPTVPQVRLLGEAADDSNNGAGMMGGAPGHDAGVRGGAGFQYGIPSSEAQESLHLAAPTQAGARARESRLRNAEAKQLVRQLDTDQSLWVAVSVPPGLARGFRDSTVTQAERAQRLSETARTLFGDESVALVEVSVPSQTVAGRARRKPERPPGSTILVEGTPENIRKSLQQLVSRSDVQVGNTTSIPKLRPDAYFSFGTQPLDALVESTDSAKEFSANADPAKDRVTISGVVLTDEKKAELEHLEGAGLDPGPGSGRARLSAKRQTEGVATGVESDPSGSTGSAGAAAGSESSMARNVRGVKGLGDTGKEIRGGIDGDVSADDKTKSADEPVDKIPRPFSRSKLALDKKDSEASGKRNPAADKSKSLAGESPFDTPTGQSSQTDARPAEAFVHILFRFKTVPAASALQEAASDDE